MNEQAAKDAKEQKQAAAQAPQQNNDPTQPIKSAVSPRIPGQNNNNQIGNKNKMGMIIDTNQPQPKNKGYASPSNQQAAAAQ